MAKYIKNGVISDGYIEVTFKNNDSIIDSAQHDNNQSSQIDIIKNKYTIFNPTDDQITNAGYTKYEDTIDGCKEAKIESIKAYNQSDDVNTFTLKGTKMWLNFDERARLKVSIDSYKSQSQTSMTKWFNNISYTYSLDTWYDMLSKLEIYASEVTNVTDKHINDISSLTNITDINAYDITNDYPEKLVYD